MVCICCKLGKGTKTYVLKCHSGPTFRHNIISENQCNTAVKCLALPIKNSSEQRCNLYALQVTAIEL